MSNPAQPHGRTISGTLRRVRDGDTLEIWLPWFNGAWDAVRLAGIDAPEQREPGFHESRRALLAMARDRPLRLELLRPERRLRCSCNRLLGFVWSPCCLLNFRMVWCGFAWPRTTNGPHQWTQALRDAEQDARDARRGLWRTGIVQHLRGL